MRLQSKATQYFHALCDVLGGAAECGGSTASKKGSLENSEWISSSEREGYLQLEEDDRVQRPVETL